MSSGKGNSFTANMKPMYDRGNQRSNPNLSTRKEFVETPESNSDE